ncbi:39K [Pieris rapae granulovirus Wuhan]|uniref:39K n=1 Tax=Pieris rapae granulovirus Wuhan TaxID=2848030 RepID=D2J4L5_9BBAC|nr:39K [Betabaculovirus arrapae]ACZ63534.1 39K [Betabaculovirus arrapae]ADO85474.1 39k [Pieris rapae granulovirus]UOS85722.1 39K [Pieris rapae granulovirus]
MVDQSHNNLEVETREEEKITTRNYLIDIKHIYNRDSLLETFNNSHFKQLMSDKTFVVKLKPEIDMNEKRVCVTKKKKTTSPYIINSFIIYTSFLSKADIKLKKDNKSWQMMGAVDPLSKAPLDKDGYEFRKLIEELEVFHKKLTFDDGNKKKTTALRRKIILYAQLMLIACYKDEIVPKPYVDEIKNDETSNEQKDLEEVNKNFLKAGEELYKHYSNFKIKTDSFKKFLKRHKLFKSDDEKFNEECGGVKRKNLCVAANANIINKRRLTVDMVNDYDDDNSMLEHNV